MLRLLIGVFAAAIASASPAAAQTYPTRPVQIMVPFPAGGSTDVGARVVAAIAEKALGQPIVIVNRTGAAGQIGWGEVARSRPDGYFLTFINLPGMNTVIADPERQTTFGIDNFIPVINQVLDPGVVWVRTESPIKSFQDLIDATKAAPGTIRASTSGILTDDHLAILMYEEATGGKVRIVHLEGSAPQVKETLAGNMDVAFDNVGSVLKLAKGGQARVLVVMDTERSKFLPDVPTTAELGFPAIISNSSRGLAAVKGTPQPVIDKLTEAFKAAMQDPDHIKRLEEAGLGLKILTGEDYARYYKDMHEKAKKYTEWAKTRQQK